MEKSNILEIFRDAMNLERDGVKFYRKAAKHSKNQKAVEVFKKLADDELQHLESLEVTYDKLVKENEWMVMKDMATPQSKELKTEDVFEDEPVNEQYDEADAVERGINAEKDSIALYEKAQKECNIDDAGKCDVFKALVDFEKEHLKALKELKGKMVRK